MLITLQGGRYEWLYGGSKVPINRSVGLFSGHAFPLQVVTRIPSGELHSCLSETEEGLAVNDRIDIVVPSLLCCLSLALSRAQHSAAWSNEGESSVSGSSCWSVSAGCSGGVSPSPQ